MPPIRLHNVSKQMLYFPYKFNRKSIFLNKIDEIILKKQN